MPTPAGRPRRGDDAVVTGVPRTGGRDHRGGQRGRAVLCAVESEVVREVPMEHPRLDGGLPDGPVPPVQLARLEHVDRAREGDRAAASAPHRPGSCHAPRGRREEHDVADRWVHHLRPGHAGSDGWRFAGGSRRI